MLLKEELEDQLQGKHGEKDGEPRKRLLGSIGAQMPLVPQRVPVGGQHEGDDDQWNGHDDRLQPDASQLDFEIEAECR